MDLTEKIRSMTAYARATPNGWLALSTPGSPIHIGVFGPTEEEALLAFKDAAEAWARLHTAPEALLR